MTRDSEDLNVIGLKSEIDSWDTMFLSYENELVYPRHGFFLQLLYIFPFHVQTRYSSKQNVI